ncbi:hypothetical protein [Streptomyces erythrochromogenes]|uniref:hypothetical protein n=1 Tax=Streptomyces erythrochromogenes TaxID=285574 RepID=UPI00368C6940
MLINDEATRQVAEIIGTALGVGFTLRNAAIANGAAHIEYPDGRTLGFRPIFGGAIVQLWIIGNAKPAGEDEPPTLALLEGHLYHAAVSLIDAEDADPADLILEKLTNDLLPAFDFKPHYVGHRPWEAAFNNALADAIAEQGSRIRDAGQCSADGDSPMAPLGGVAPGSQPEESSSPTEPTAVGEPAAGLDLPEGERWEPVAEEVVKPSRPRKSGRRTPAASSAS